MLCCLHHLLLKESTKAPSPLPHASWRTTHYVRVRHPEGHAIHGAATTTEPVIQISQIITDNHRVHILVEMKQGQCICPLSWSIHCNFTFDGNSSERGWACTPHPYQPG
jgi:hypothetical protein